MIKAIMLDISKTRKFDESVITETLIDLLKIIDNLLKFVSEFVKKALQVKL